MTSYMSHIDVRCPICHVPVRERTTPNHEGYLAGRLKWTCPNCNTQSWLPKMAYVLEDGKCRVSN